MELPCTSDCRLCFEKLCMQKIPVFANLSRPELEKIVRLIVHRSYSKGQVIVPVEAMTDGITIINSGKLKASRYTADGREQILYLFTEGDFFGEHSLFNDQPTPYQIEALTPVSLCHLYRSDFQQLLKNLPDLAWQIIAALSERLASLENFISQQDLDKRILGLLGEFAQKYGSPQEGGLLVQLPLSREGIANYLGIARETLSRKFSQLESDGLIRSIGNRTIQIPDPDLLAQLLD